MTPWLALAASALAADSPGILVGCVFLKEGSTEARQYYSGFGLYLPSADHRGPLPASAIRNPDGILGPSGFAEVSSGPGWIRFKGRNRLRLLDTGGGIFRAEIDSETGWKPYRPGTCQLGSFPDRESAFRFFDELMAGMDEPQ